jgi:hypothetical protein
MKRPGLWFLVGVAFVGAYYVYSRRPDLVDGIRNPNTADLSAATSEAAAAYERYATAMATRQFETAAAVSVESAHQNAMTRVNAARGSRSSGSGDRVYLSKAALDEMARTQVPADEEAAFSYDYEVFDQNEPGTIVKLAAVQTLHSESRTTSTAQRATVMQISGEWKVSEFWRPDAD